MIPANATTSDPAAVTPAHLSEIQFPGVGTFALITLGDPGSSKPAVLGPHSLPALGTLLTVVKVRAAAGDFIGVGITGQQRYFLAGADLDALRRLDTTKSARAMAQLGHDVFAILDEIDVPTFAFINGAAIGGGLEIALAAKYRTVSSEVSAISLPETFLGLIPGWGGVYRLPRLIGPANAVKIMIDNPLGNNRSLDGRSAFEVGIADTMFAPENFLNDSIAWAASVISGDTGIVKALTARRETKAAYTHADWDAAVDTGRTVVQTKTVNAVPAPQRLLDLLERGRNLSRTESADLEVDALTELILSAQFKNSAYAFLELLVGRAKNPAGAPDVKLARPIRKVGVVGAGLMAGQLALLFARQLKVPVVLTDIDQARVDRGLEHVHRDLDRLAAKNHLTPDVTSGIKSLITGSVSKESFADADFVIEAVFEEISVKKHVFAEVEAVVRPECILATNTSSLSVAEMASDLAHPERLVGLHFFNPVAAMPLLEIIQGPRTSDEVLATAFALGQALRKTGVLVQDSTAFVVNRVLLRLMGEVTRAIDEGTPANVADHALKPLGLPMTPFTLLGMIGLPVCLHVTRSLNAAFGERFPVSPNQQRLVDHGITSLWEQNSEGCRRIPARTWELLEIGDSPSTSEELLVRVQDALAEEIAQMLDEGVVASAQDIDLCMITGAGWPLHLGGITPYLDQTGASERATGRLFHPVEQY